MSDNTFTRNIASPVAPDQELLDRVLTLRQKEEDEAEVELEEDDEESLRQLTDAESVTFEEGFDYMVEYLKETVYP